MDGDLRPILRTELRWYRWIFLLQLSQNSSGSVSLVLRLHSQVVRSRLPPGSHPDISHKVSLSTSVLPRSRIWASVLSIRTDQWSFDSQVYSPVVLFQNDTINNHIVVEAGWRGVPQHSPLHNAGTSLSQLLSRAEKRKENSGVE